MGQRDDIVALPLLLSRGPKQLYANRFGSQIVPAPRAVSLSAGDRAAQGLLRTAEVEAIAQQQETDS